MTTDEPLITLQLPPVLGDVPAGGPSWIVEFDGAPRRTVEWGAEYLDIPLAAPEVEPR